MGLRLSVGSSGPRYYYMTCPTEPEADPTDGSMMIFLAHNNLEPAQLAQGIGIEIHGAIGRFHALSAERPGAS